MFSDPFGVRQSVWVDSATVWLPRRFYVFALRDGLPLPDAGWSVHVHASECGGENVAQLRCTTDSCRSIHCRFTTFHGDSSGFVLAMSDLQTVLNQLTGCDADESGRRRARSSSGPAMMRSFSWFTA